MVWLIIIGLIIAAVIFYKASNLKNGSDHDNTNTAAAPRTQSNNAPLPPFKLLDDSNAIITDAEIRAAEKLYSDTDSFRNEIQKAQSGDASSMCFLGMFLNESFEVPKKSVYWMQRAALAGDVKAIYWLGHFYCSGYCVPKDNETGLMFFICAALRGYKDAVVALQQAGMTVEQMRSLGINI